MQQNLYSFRFWTSLAIVVLGLSLHLHVLGQQRRVFMAIEDVRIVNNQTRFMFGEDVRLRFRLVNRSRDTLVLRDADSLEFTLYYRVFQVDAPVTDSIRLSRILLRNTRLTPGDSVPLANASPQTFTVPLASNQLMPGGTVVVIWPRGAYVIPAQVGRVEFEIVPTDRHPFSDFHRLRLHPNPNGLLPDLSLQVPLQALSLFDLQGRLLYLSRSLEELRLTSQDLPPGLYALVITDVSGQTCTLRWLKP
jgi:hypothetical protein